MPEGCAATREKGDEKMAENDNQETDIETMAEKLGLALTYPCDGTIHIGPDYVAESWEDARGYLRMLTDEGA